MVALSEIKNTTIVQGEDGLLQGGIDPNISRGFLMEIKKFPGGLRKNKRFPGPNSMGKFQGYSYISFQGH